MNTKAESELCALFVVQCHVVKALQLFPFVACLEQILTPDPRKDLRFFWSYLSGLLATLE